MLFTVLYEDNHLIIVSKKSGVLVQGDATGDKPLAEHVKEYLKKKYDKPGNVFCGVVHRLDRPVSGLVVLAKTSKALERMNKLFQTREVKKTYWAVAKNKPKAEQGTLIHWLLKNQDKNITKPYDREITGSQRAELHYRLLGEVSHHYLIEVNPITGRPHQIRVQLASMDCPIKGDLKYGAHGANPDASIHLHARSIAFIHPVSKEPIEVTAPVPNEPLWKQCEAFVQLDM